MNVLERMQGPLALVGALSLAVAAGLGLVFGEFGVPSRIALAFAILCLGGAFAIDPGAGFRWLTRRESVYGSNAVLMTLAFIGILAVVNVAANRFSQRWDLTAQRDFSLSEGTLKILNELPQPVSATAFFSSSLNDKQKTEDLLKEYQVRSNGRFTWEMVDTNQEPARARFANVNVDGTIQFRMAERKQDTITPDEAHITTALIKLVNPVPLKIYFITGHGERQLDKFDEAGYSDLQTQIQADNFILQPLNLLAAQRVPEDAAALIIAAPKSAFLEAELSAIKTYLDGKGRMVLLVDPMQPDANPGEIIKRWDLTFFPGVVVDPVSSLQQSPLDLIVQRYGQHAIVKDLGAITVMPFSQGIEIPNFIKRGVDVSSLAMTFDARSWVESDTQRVSFDEGTDRKGPINLAVAIEEIENPETQQETLPGFQDPNRRIKNRAVIIGTSEMVTNGLVKQSFSNRDFFLNSLNWVTQTDQLITTRPRIEERRTVFLTPTQSNFVFFSSALFLPLLLLAAGTVVWWTRR